MESEASVDNILELALKKGTNWWDGIQGMVPNMVVALVIVLVFWIIAKLSKKLLWKTHNRFSDNQVLRDLFSVTTYYLIMSVGIFIALGVLKLDKAVTSLLAGLGIIGLAISFAFQDIVANFISGIIIAVRQPFKVGDVVKIQGFMGPLVRTNLRVSVVKTWQGQEVYIPNSKVLSNPIINYSVLGELRIDLPVRAHYGDDLEKVEEITKNAIGNMEHVIRKEDMIFTYTDFDSSSVNFEIKYWIKYPISPSFLEMRNRGIKAVRKAFRENGLQVPYPVRKVHMDTPKDDDLAEYVK